MFRKAQSEVLIVGAGPVGLFTALVLAERGIEVEIVDSQKRTAARSYALALHPGSLQLLAGAGIADDLVARAHRVDRLAFCGSDGPRAEIDFSRLPGEYPFVLVLPQETLEEIFVARLAARGIEVGWNRRVADVHWSDQQASVTIEHLNRDAVGYSVEPAGTVIEKTSVTRTAFVVGADGHSSAVRRALGIHFEELREPKFFAVFELGAEDEVGAVEHVVLEEGTTSVLWPLGGKRARWSFELAEKWEFVPNTRAKDRLSVAVGEQAFPYLDEEKLGQLLRERAPWAETGGSDLSWSIAVRFDYRLAERFGRDNLWLVGDAAHLASPVGVHSMNVGLREGHDLARRLSEILRRDARAELLEGYARERTGEWRKLLGLEGEVAVEAGADDWVRRRAARIPSCIPASGEDLELLLGQIGLGLDLS